jgi:hypothetical protein
MATRSSQPRPSIVAGLLVLFIILLGMIIVHETKPGKLGPMLNQNARLNPKGATNAKSSKPQQSPPHSSPGSPTTIACSPGWYCSASGKQGACAIGDPAPNQQWEYSGKSCGVVGCQWRCYRISVKPPVTTGACGPGWTCTARGTKEQCAMAGAPTYPVEYAGACGVEGCRGQCFRKK